MGVCAIVSFRLGLSDGVSVVAALWQREIEAMGWSTITVAGEGPVDHVIPGLAIDATEPPTEHELRAVLDQADVVVIENLLSIPLNLPASLAVAAVLAGRPALLHHHDPPWQRTRFAHITELPPDDPSWRHVTINRFTEKEFAERGLAATTIYNGFDSNVEPGDRGATRAWLGLSDTERLAVHPVRAIARKNVPAAIDLCQRLGAVYWLPGKAEEGYDDELASILARARCPVLRRPISDAGLTMADLYAASDVVLFPSTWEGFGNPPVEAALHRRPAIVGDYPVADELRGLGFHWFGVDDVDEIADALRRPPLELLATNHHVASSQLSVEAMAERIDALFTDAGWTP